MLCKHRWLGVPAVALLAALALPSLAAVSRTHAQSAPQPPANAVEVTSANRGQTIYVGVGQPLLVQVEV